jgi:hypothetical protein
MAYSTLSSYAALVSYPACSSSSSLTIEYRIMERQVSPAGQKTIVRREKGFRSRSEVNRTFDNILEKCRMKFRPFSWLPQ